MGRLVVSRGLGYTCFTTESMLSRVDEVTNAICDSDLRMTVSFSSALTSSAQIKNIF